MTQTVTLQDATVADLKVALAGTAPAPAPTPPPTPAPPPAGNLVTLMSGSDGPNAFVSYDVNTKATWLTVRSYLKGSTGGTFAGNFLDFQCMNNAGAWGSGVLINGGYVTAVPGSENGDLDVVFMVDGVQANISFCGKWSGQPAGLLPWPSQLLSLGGPVNRYLELWLWEVALRPGQAGPNPPGVVGWVKCNGGWLPKYA